MAQQNREERVARALEMHAAGFNCAQCVACACADVVGLDKDEAFRLMGVELLHPVLCQRRRQP